MGIFDHSLSFKKGRADSENTSEKFPDRILVNIRSEIPDSDPEVVMSVFICKIDTTLILSWLDEQVLG